jgi:hypothetical protein
MYFSPGDVGRFYVRAVEAENISFALMFATSQPNGDVLNDTTEARELLGFEPQDSYPIGLPYPIPQD